MNEDQQPTAWEDINPTTALARQPERPSPSLALHPASADEFRNELTACLALVAPVGMTEESRREWLSVAWATVGHLPSNVLRVGCKKARETADHPSKIVPTIIAETEEMMRWRRQAARAESDPPRRYQIDGPEPCSPIEARQIMEEFGIPTLDAKRPAPPGPLRKPTRQDYIDLGVDPAVLDGTEDEDG